MMLQPRSACRSRRCYHFVIIIAGAIQRGVRTYIIAGAIQRGGAMCGLGRTCVLHPMSCVPCPMPCALCPYRNGLSTSLGRRQIPCHVPSGVSCTAGAPASSFPRGLPRCVCFCGEQPPHICDSAGYRHGYVRAGWPCPPSRVPAVQDMKSETHAIAHINPARQDRHQAELDTGTFRDLPGFGMVGFTCKMALLLPRFGLHDPLPPHQARRTHKAAHGQANIHTCMFYFVFYNTSPQTSWQEDGGWPRLVFLRSTNIKAPRPPLPHTPRTCFAAPG